MEVGCRKARAIYLWLAIPKYQPWDVRHPSHWITMEKDRCQKQSEPAGLKGHTMRWRSQRIRGGTTKTTKSQLSLEGAMGTPLVTTTHTWRWLSLESSMGITLHTTSTHPWGSSHLRVPGWNTNTPSAHPWVGSRLSAMGTMQNITPPHPWDCSRESAAR